MPAQEQSVSPSRMSSSALAFMGDGIYGLMARHHVLKTNPDLPASRLHRLTVKLVEARAQSRAYAVLEPLLTEREGDIMRRGRNSNSGTVPRHADQADYRRATGVETLFGYLYLNGDYDRITELFDAIVEGGEDHEPER